MVRSLINIRTSWDAAHGRVDCEAVIYAGEGHIERLPLPAMGLAQALSRCFADGVDCKEYVLQQARGYRRL